MPVPTLFEMRAWREVAQSLIGLRVWNWSFMESTQIHGATGVHGAACRVMQSLIAHKAVTARELAF
jgi:hypothetical protein